MKFNVKFRKMKRSEELAAFFEDRFTKLQKFETKPVVVTATLSVERHSCQVSVQLSGRDLQMRASATEANFYDAIEKVMQRCFRQMSRKKAKVQNHKCYPRSKQGRLESLRPEAAMEAAFEESQEAA